MIKVGILKDEDERERVRKYLGGLENRFRKRARESSSHDINHQVAGAREAIQKIELHLCGEEIPR